MMGVQADSPGLAALAAIAGASHHGLAPDPIAFRIGIGPEGKQLADKPRWQAFGCTHFWFLDNALEITATIEPRTV